MPSPGRCATPLLGSMSAEGLQELLAASLTLAPAASSPDAQGTLLLLTFVHTVKHSLVHSFITWWFLLESGMFSPAVEVLFGFWS